MKKAVQSLIWLYSVILWLFILGSCNNSSSRETEIARHISIDPVYGNVLLQNAGDTLHFLLGEDRYHTISCFNYFQDNQSDFLSFYDPRSRSINIYHLISGIPIKSMQLDTILPGRKFYKTSVFAKSMDSIFISNLNTFYILDTAGRVLDSINSFNRTDAMVSLQNTTPLVERGKDIYTGIKPYVNETSIKDLKDWRVLYRFNFGSKEKEVLYQLPETYLKAFYGDRFLNYSYCANDRGNMVFSFPADSNIYETNLTDYNVSYYGKSRFHEDVVKPVPEKDLLNDMGFKHYLIRDSYGPIYYDANRKMYYRVAKMGISEEEFNNGNRTRDQSLIFFDHNFKIVGEAMLDSNISTSSLFITKSGDIFIRTQVSDEYALHFERFKLVMEGSGNKEISKK